MNSLLLGALLTLISGMPHGPAERLNIPPRPADAEGGSAIVKEIEALTPEQREERIRSEIGRGNVPDFERNLVPVSVAASIEGKIVNGRVFVLPDYLAVGSNSDYFYVPLTPFSAQKVADDLDCSLPTPAIVDAIYFASQVKLDPAPIPPSASMTTVPVFWQHTQMVVGQRQASLAQFPLGALTAGDKKDIVICKGLKDTPDHVAIYGWHRSDGQPIQPLFLGHTAAWADYSHGERLISDTMEVEGKRMELDRVLKDPKLWVLVSSEGPLTQARYVIDKFPQPKGVTPVAQPVSTGH